MTNVTRLPAAAPLEARGVTREYRLNRMLVRAVCDVSFRVPGGSLFALAGSSGSGKSTLLNLLGGVDFPTAGAILVEGRELGRMDADAQARLRAEKIGFVFQTFNLLPVLTAIENVEYPLLILGLAAAERRRLAEQALAKVGLATHGHHRPADLSGGQRQRVAIARALVKRPAVILADEPTANLDQSTTREILALLDDLRRGEGMTLVIASHDPLVLEKATDGVRLCDGKIVEGIRRADQLDASQGAA